MCTVCRASGSVFAAQFGEQISWSTTGKVNFLMDNLIAAGKIKPFAIVMGNGMVKQRIDGA